jgi:hypothetical protein
VIYEIEKRLNLAHLDIARLLEPKPIGLDLVVGICASPQTPQAVTTFDFTLKATDVTRLISGGGKELSKVAAKRLCLRLDIALKSYAAFAKTGELLATDGRAFSRDTVAKYHQGILSANREDVEAGYPYKRRELLLMYPDRVTIVDSRI